MRRADTPSEARRTLPQELFDFLKTYGIMGLAIAFVIGWAASRLVTAFVNDIIDPIIESFLPAGSPDAVSFNLSNLAGTNTEFRYRDLISKILDFAIIAMLVCFAYKQLARHGFVENKTKPATKEKI